MKTISFSKSIIFILILAIIVGLYIFDQSKKINFEEVQNQIVQSNKDTSKENIESVNLIDTNDLNNSESECSDPSDVTGGYRFRGEVVTGKEMEVVLSCDLTKLIISGSVDQIITTAGIPGTESELADISSGTLVVDIENDYNFDGYKDISSVHVNGSGSSQIDSSLYFLYDVEQNKYIYNDVLSKLQNLSVDDSAPETLKQSFSYGWGYGGQNIFYKWEDGKLIKMREEIIEADR